jgi:NADH-quinone oxidoreductase subunit N
MINSVIGAYYYVRVMVHLYMREPAPGAAVAVPMRSGLVMSAIVIAAMLVLALGSVPGRLLDLAAGAGL